VSESNNCNVSMLRDIDGNRDIEVQWIMLRDIK